jgi:hypothetical protein
MKQIQIFSNNLRKQKFKNKKHIINLFLIRNKFRQLSNIFQSYWSNLIINM